MEEYSKAVSEMYSQFKQKEAHPMGKYIGRYVAYQGLTEKVVGYLKGSDGSYGPLIVDASQSGGWATLSPHDVIFKDCKYYWYVSSSNVID